MTSRAPIGWAMRTIRQAAPTSPPGSTPAKSCWPPSWPRSATGLPPAEFDLQLDVQLPRRHRPQRGGPGLAHAAAGQVLGLPSRQDHAFYVGVVVDVTAQQRFERELGELVDRYRLLTEVSPDVVIVHQDGLLVYGNRAMARLIGARPTRSTPRHSPSTTGARSPTSSTPTTSPTWPSAWPS